ncbi:carboxypeptidase-like regulatory domain-containing protein [Granulicella rosea]|nr:carboxypeptidase-like regulatory domain-containing protein [Granulicella rosea]
MSFFRRISATALALTFATGLVCPQNLVGQDDSARRGRKYKAPPEVSHIEITVIKGTNKKPIANAAVIFHPMKDGKDEGNLEVKTDPDGKAVIDVIPTGSRVVVQVLADGFATYAETFDIPESSRSILVAMKRPQAQISKYEDNRDKPADRKPGVQEPDSAPKVEPPPASAK